MTTQLHRQLPVRPPRYGVGQTLRAIRSLVVATLLALASARAANSAPPQSDSLRQLRFSPDGRYVLAQDASEITILTAQPLAVLFRIAAENASDAQFTPDSLQVLFLGAAAGTDRQATTGPEPTLRTRSGPRVERWTVATRTRVESPEIRGLACGTEELSPDGGTVARDDPGGTLRIVDTATGQSLFEKQNFVSLIPIYNYLQTGSVDLPNGQFLGDLRRASLDFSPDGRFLLARPSGGEGKAVAWDLHERRLVNLTWKLRGIGGKFCVFVAPHRLLIPTSSFQGKSGAVTAELVAFPSAERLSKLKVPVGPLVHTSDPDFVLARPFGRGSFWNPNGRRTAAEHLSTGETIVSDTPALDVLGRYYVAEPSPGTVGIYERGKGLQSTVPLHPTSPTMTGRDRE